MCGIAGFVIKQPADTRPLDREKLLDELIQGIDSRGGDATGFVARNTEGDVAWHKASCDARKFLPHRRRLPAGATVALAHTRWATQGHESFPENNHPIKRGPIFVIHNGHVTNDYELFAQVERERYGQVDSEAIAAVLAHAGTLDIGATREPVEKALGSIEGAAAIAALDERDGTVLLARMSSSPLYVLETRRLILWASTAAAVCEAHERAIGSLGRAQAFPMFEGDAFVIRDGRCLGYHFKPAPVRVFTQAPAPAITGTYLPADSPVPNLRFTGTIHDDPKPHGRFSFLTRRHKNHDPNLEEDPTIADWEGDDLVCHIPTPSRHDTPNYAPERCDVCGDLCGDTYDYWDGSDIWDLCQTCYGTFSDGSPEPLH